VVVVVVGGTVVVVVGAGGTVVVVVGAFAASSFSATDALVLVLLLGVKLATVAVALPCVVDTDTPPGDEDVGVDGAAGGAVVEPPLPLLALLPAPGALKAGFEKSGFDCPGAPAFSALRVGTLTVPVLAATTTSESAAAATLTVAMKRFLTIPPARGPNASAIAEAGANRPPSESGLPKFLEAKTSSRVAFPSTADALSGFERCIPPPVDSALCRVYCPGALTPGVLRDS
jgi:hypothetical protein